MNRTATRLGPIARCLSTASVAWQSLAPRLGKSLSWAAVATTYTLGGLFVISLVLFALALTWGILEGLYIQGVPWVVMVGVGATLTAIGYYTLTTRDANLRLDKLVLAIIGMFWPMIATIICAGLALFGTPN